MKVKLTGLAAPGREDRVARRRVPRDRRGEDAHFQIRRLDHEVPDRPEEEDRVTAKLKPLIFDETTKTWDVELELIYPPRRPVFESFEEHKWLRDNRLQLSRRKASRSTRAART